jgi:hypothetical protein
MFCNRKLHTALHSKEKRSAKRSYRISLRCLSSGWFACSGAANLPLLDDAHVSIRLCGRPCRSTHGAFQRLPSRENRVADLVEFGCAFAQRVFQVAFLLRYSLVQVCDIPRIDT